MSQDRFDTLTRGLATKTSRKQLLRSLAGGSLAAASVLLGRGRAEARGATKNCCRYVCGAFPSSIFYTRCSRNACPPPEIGCVFATSYFVTNCSDCSV